MNKLEQCLAMATGNRSRRSTRCVYNLIQNDIDAAYWKNPWGAQDYYVDGNMVTSGDGTSWDEAVDDLSDAITLSNASIGLAGNRWWARRNRIYACGDQELVENLTVLPEKCDIIGVGTDLLPFPRMVGNHTIAAGTVGCRIFNMGFYTNATGDLWVIPDGCHGFHMVGCWMHPGTTSTKALEITTCAHVRIIDNTITVGAGDMAVIFGVGISIEGTSVHDTVIAGNNITATIGVVVVEATAAAMGSRIEDNYIRATGLTIDDNSDDFQVINNRLMTDAVGDNTAACAAFDINLALAVGNRLTCNDHLNAPLPVEGTLA
jgi:hypothetical protein